MHKIVSQTQRAGTINVSQLPVITNEYGDFYVLQVAGSRTETIEHIVELLPFGSPRVTVKSSPVPNHLLSSSPSGAAYQICGSLRSKGGVAYAIFTEGTFASEYITVSKTKGDLPDLVARDEDLFQIALIPTYVNDLEFSGVVRTYEEGGGTVALGFDPVGELPGLEVTAVPYVDSDRGGLFTGVLTVDHGPVGDEIVTARGVLEAEGVSYCVKPALGVATGRWAANAVNAASISRKLIAGLTDSQVAITPLGGGGGETRPAAVSHFIAESAEGGTRIKITPVLTDESRASTVEVDGGDNVPFPEDWPTAIGGACDSETLVQNASGSIIATVAWITDGLGIAFDLDQVRVDIHFWVSGCEVIGTGV